MTELNKFELMSFGTKAVLDTTSKMLRHKREIDEIKGYFEILDYIKESFGEIDKEKEIEFPSESASIKIIIEKDKMVQIFFKGQHTFSSKIFLDDGYANTLIDENGKFDKKAVASLVKDEDVEYFVDKEALAEKLEK